MSSKKSLRQLVDGPDRSLFPTEFLKAVRRALDVGLTCEQISTVIILASVVVELKGCFEGRGLQERVEWIIEEMRGFHRNQPECEKISWFTGREE